MNWTMRPRTHGSVTCHWQRTWLLQRIVFHHIRTPCWLSRCCTRLIVPAFVAELPDNQFERQHRDTDSQFGLVGCRCQWTSLASRNQRFLGPFRLKLTSPICGGCGPPVTRPRERQHRSASPLCISWQRGHCGHTRRGPFFALCLYSRVR